MEGIRAERRIPLELALVSHGWIEGRSVGLLPAQGLRLLQYPLPRCCFDASRY